MIKGNVALLLLVYSAALAAAPGVSDTSYAAATKQMCDGQAVGQGQNGDWAFIGRYHNANAELIGAGEMRQNCSTIVERDIALRRTTTTVPDNFFKRVVLHR